MPEIAVIIPAYVQNGNQYEWLFDAIASVKAQTFTDWELIIVDDFSPYQISGMPHYAKVINHDKRRGPGAARNTGVAAASAEWIVALDADDCLTPNALQDMYAARCETGYVYGDLQWIGERQGVHRTEDWTVYGLFKLTGLLPVTALHSRTAWRAVGGWDEKLSALEDNEYWMRLAGIGVCGRRINATVLQYRKHSDSRQSLLEQDKQKHIALTNSIRQKHAALYSRLGDMARGCTKCPGSSGPGNGVVFMAEGVENGVELKYVGLMRGSFQLHGRATGIKYKIDGTGSYVTVDSRDVPAFLEMQIGGVPNFVESGASRQSASIEIPQSVALVDAPSADKPNITDLKAKDAIALIEETSDVLDLRVWLAEERANDAPRSTVIAALEKRIEEVEPADA